MKYRVSLIVVLVLLVVGVYALAGSRGNGGKGAIGLVELRVENMTCGSCVKNIQQALSGVEGVGNVEVSVTSSRAKVEYAPSLIKAGSIAQRISAAGYPAEVGYQLTPAEFQSMKEDESRLASKFVARIGERLITREYFDQKVQARQKVVRFTGKKDLYKDVWQEILPRQLVLVDAEHNGVVVQDGEVDVEYQRVQDKTKGFDALVKTRYGGEEAYKILLKEEMIINRNIEEHVLKSEGKSLARKAQLNSWYKKLARETPMVIFDPDLKAAVNTGGDGCGGACC